MPDTIITVAEFLSETHDDISSPTTSNFVARMGACRNAVSALEEVGICVCDIGTGFAC